VGVPFVEPLTEMPAAGILNQKSPSKNIHSKMPGIQRSGETKLSSWHFPTREHRPFVERSNHTIGVVVLPS
jgi:hypothetical protein